MKKIVFNLGLLSLFAAMALPIRAAEQASASAVTPPPAIAAVAAVETPKPPSVDDRLADLEAAINNGARQTNSATALEKSPAPGHNAFQMICSALVLFMTLPGLALFYGGLVRRKSVLSVLAQCFGITGLVTILWWAGGYSIAFHSGKPFWGGLDWAFLKGVDSTPNTDYGAWVSHNIYSIYQLMFAIITPALIVGAIAERMKYSAILLFVVGWMFVVYFPLAHMVWGVDGLMNGVSRTISAADMFASAANCCATFWASFVSFKSAWALFAI